MSNKKFGYARVSTTDQNEDRQVLDLMEYGIDERDIYVDKQSGRSFERTNYLALRNTILRDGDVLVVKSIDRFGRNYSAIRIEWEYLTKTLGVDIVVLDKVLFEGKERFIWGRRTSGSFLLKTINGEKIKDGEGYKHLTLLERSQNYLIF